MSRYAIQGGVTRELLTYRGRVLTHDNRAEMEWLFPAAKIVRITGGKLGQPVMRLRDHPHFEGVRWPLRREDFV